MTNSKPIEPLVDGPEPPPAEDCTCMMHGTPESNERQVILAPSCPIHGVAAQPALWQTPAIAPDAIVVFGPDVEPDHLQEAIQLATRNWPEWQCLIVAAHDAGVWAKEPTPVLSGPELLDHLRQLDLDKGPHRDAALLAKILGGGDAADATIVSYGDRHERAGEPILQLDYSGVDVTEDEAARLVELGAVTLR